MRLPTSAPVLQLSSGVGAGAGAGQLPAGWSDSLFNRLVLAGDPRTSVVPVLDKWVDEGKPVEKRDLQWMVKQMRSFRRYRHALQISTWMGDKRFSNLSRGDLVERVDLLSKVEGIEHAENYFHNISKRFKGPHLYNALLSCYVDQRAVEKAEALFQEIKRLKMLKSSSYNLLIKLYSLIGQHSKVDATFEELEKAGISPDNFTYSALMDAYVVASDVSAIDKLLERIEHSKVSVNWYVYISAAKGYSKAGLIEKTLSALKKSEILVPRGNGRVAYGFLLALYADIGIKDELYRIWKVYKSSEKIRSSMYMCIISSLLKIGDIKGAEEIFEEWESSTTFYDFRVPNLLVAAYCKNGLLSKAESLVSKAIENGRTPFANTWSRLAGAYFENGDGPKAVETMKKALIAAKNVTWKPDFENVIVCLEYFKEQKDAEGADEFVALLRQLGPFTPDILNCLLKVYHSFGKRISDVLHQMKADGFDAVELQNICEEEARKVSP